MMNVSRYFAFSAILLLALAFAAVPPASAQYAPSTPPPTRWQPPPPPAAWPAQEHHGYMDGVEAAWLDLASGLKPKPSRHLQYQHPPNVPISRQYLYREGFRKGYKAVYRHNRQVHPHHPDLAVKH